MRGLWSDQGSVQVASPRRRITRYDEDQLVNRMRHGNFLDEGSTLYVLETHPAGYALIATNEAEKAADIDVLEFRAIGAFGRVYLGGDEASIQEAAKAALSILDKIDGRPNPGR